MSSTAPTLQRGVFEDEVVNSSTLAKQTSKGNRSCSSRPTCDYNPQQRSVPLASCDYASRLLKANKQMGDACQVLAAASHRLMGKHVDLTNSHQWVSVLGEKDLRKMVSEVVALLDRALADPNIWEDIDASIYGMERELPGSPYKSKTADAFNMPNVKVAVTITCRNEVTGLPKPKGIVSEHATWMVTARSKKVVKGWEEICAAMPGNAATCL